MKSSHNTVLLIGLICFLPFISACSNQNKNSGQTSNGKTLEKIKSKAQKAISKNKNDASPQEVTFSVEDYPPFVTQHLPGNGILGTIVREALKLEGLKVTLKFYPPNRAFKLAQSGQSDGSFPWANRTSRHASFFYGEPLIEADDERFFFKQGLTIKWNAQKQDYTRISGWHVIAILGSNYGKRFQEAEKNKIIKVSRVSTNEQAFAMLLSNRAKLFISPERVARYYIKHRLPAKQQGLLTDMLAIDEPKEFDYLIISKRSKNGEMLLKAFNKGIKRLKSSGRYCEIIQSFNF